MNVDKLLASLRKVRPTANGEWVACCPAHEDKTPSLAIKDNGDGRILIHCFAGCPVENVVSSVGLNLSDLMPENQPMHHALRRVPFNSRTVLEAIAFSATMVAIAASDMSAGKPVSVADKDALWDVSNRITEAVDYATR